MISNSFHIFTEEEWEALCDNCGICCLYKIEEQSTETLYFTRIICEFYNKTTRNCMVYPERTVKMKTCVRLTPDNLEAVQRWLPKHCSYRCLLKGMELPKWHPLLAAEDPLSRSTLSKFNQFVQEPLDTEIGSFKITKTIRKAKSVNIDMNFEEKLLNNLILDTDL